MAAFGFGPGDLPHADGRGGETGCRGDVLEDKATNHLATAVTAARELEIF